MQFQPRFKYLNSRTDSLSCVSFSGICFLIECISILHSKCVWLLVLETKHKHYNKLCRYHHQCQQIQNKKHFLFISLKCHLHIVLTCTSYVIGFCILHVHDMTTANHDHAYIYNQYMSTWTLNCAQEITNFCSLVTGLYWLQRSSKCGQVNIWIGKSWLCSFNTSFSLLLLRTRF